MILSLIGYGTQVEHYCAENSCAQLWTYGIRTPISTIEHNRNEDEIIHVGCQSGWMRRKSYNTRWRKRSGNESRWERRFVCWWRLDQC